MKPACPHCGGSGFIHTQRMFKEWRLVRHPATPGQYVGKMELDEDGAQIYEEVEAPRDYASMCACHAREARA